MPKFDGEKTRQLLGAAEPRLLCKACLEVSDINAFSYAVLIFCKEALG